MKVAFVHNLKAGGARRTMAEHMARLDADVTEVCLQTAVPVRGDATVVPVRVLAPSLPRALRPPARYRDLAAILVAWRRAADRVTALQADAVVAHPCQFLQAPPALTRIRSSLLFCHEVRRVDHDPEARAQRRMLTRMPYALLYALERRSDAAAVVAATALVTNSVHTAREVRRAYGRVAEVLPLGVPATFTAGPYAPPRHALSVGSLITSKGHDLAIAAVARSRRRWPLVIVAPADEPAESARLREQAASLGVRLEIRISVSDGELRELYRSAVATLYLAVAEPLGLVSLEAQACGCPVVVSAGGGLPETVLEGRTGWAVARDAGLAAERLDRLEDAPQRHAMALAAARHGAAFTWEESTRRLRTAIDEMLAGTDADSRPSAGGGH